MYHFSLSLADDISKPTQNEPFEYFIDTKQSYIFLEIRTILRKLHE